MKHPWTAFVPYVIVAIVHLVAILVGAETLTDIAATARMPLLALGVILAMRGMSLGLSCALLLAAIALSWFGGLSGSFLGGLSLPGMLLFFGLAHICYIWLFWRRLAVQRVPWWALVYAVWWVGIIVVLLPRLGGFTIAIAVYGLILAGTAVAAARCRPLIAWGGAAFLASDTFLSLVIFFPEAVAGWGFPMAMLTYNGGQGLLAFGAVIAMRELATQCGGLSEPAAVTTA